jgi:16S rRNA (adenine1518-N6/adenine1519-N6)-dimethyltransferase
MNLLSKSTTSTVAPMLEQSIALPSLAQRMQAGITKHRIQPHEALGQNFLIDQAALNSVVSHVGPGSIVLEVGPGLGQLTQGIANQAMRVVAVEIDTQFKPCLDAVVAARPNVQVLYQDVLAPRSFEEYFLVGGKNGDHTRQVVSNLPFHISEPFLRKLAGTRFDDAVLLIGAELGERLMAKNENALGFSKTTLVGECFFEVSEVCKVPRQAFHPVPSTDGAIVRVVPRDMRTMQGDKRLFVLRRMLEQDGTSVTAGHCIKQALIDYAQNPRGSLLSKREFHQRARRSVNAELRGLTQQYNHRILQGEAEGDEQGRVTQSSAQQLLAALEIPEATLSKALTKLVNADWRFISLCLRSRKERSRLLRECALTA